MTSSVKKIGLLLILTIVLAYISFPWWASSLVKQILPEDFSIQRLELGYPDWKGLKVEQLYIYYHDIEVSLSNISTNFSLNNIQIDQITLKLPGQKVQNTSQLPTNLLNIPELHFSGLIKKINPVQLQVSSVAIQYDDYQFYLANLKAIVKPLTDIPARLAIEFELKPNPFLPHQNEVQLSSSITSTELSTELAINNQKLLTLDYLNQTSTLKLLATFNTGQLIPLISPYLTEKQIKISDYTVKGTSEIIMTQDKKDKNLTSEISFQGNLWSNLQQAPPALLKLKASSSSRKFPFLLDMQIEGEMEKVFTLDSIKLQSPKFNATSQLNIMKDRLRITNFQVSKTFSEINLPENNTKIQHLSINSTVDDFAVPLSDASQIKINSQFSNASLFATRLQSTPQAKAKISGDIAISILPKSNSPEMILSGKLEVTQIEIPELLESAAAKIIVQISDINESLTNGKLNVDFEDHNSKISNTRYRNIKSNIEIELTKEGASGEGQLYFDDILISPLSLTANRSPQSIELILAENQLNITLLNRLIRQNLTTGFPLIKILKGEITHSGSIDKLLDSPSSLIVDNQLKINRGELLYEKNHAENINLSMAVHSYDPLLAESKITVEEVNLASGLVLENLSIQVKKPDNERLEVRDLSLDLLSGQLTCSAINFQHGIFSPTTLELNDISLTELIFFTELENLYATGQLDISIPLLYEDNSIIIKNAEFKSLNEGVIKFNSETQLENDNIALAALKNFHYKALNGHFNYNDKTGLYLIRIHLLGANPDLYDGFPVDFTFNIDGNLPGAFKSLLLTGSFEQSILSSINKKNG